MPDFEVSIGATIHEESSTPADIVAGGVASTPVKTYFQIDAIALKMTLKASWGMRNPAHVSVVAGVTW